ncbi:unnamed protein product [Moneuplotes crassus]|uniref:Uncharacterized protein n=1 Tax=Euplotes crassus TaxID=5936 RepID=A0AAD2D1E6_EUPCR|nr:unnamed protein product [Moneuplotes crassus]
MDKTPLTSKPSSELSLQKDLDEIDEFVFKLKLHTLFEYNKACHYRKLRLSISRAQYRDCQMIKELNKLGTQRIMALGSFVFRALQTSKDREVNEFMDKSFPKEVAELMLDDFPKMLKKPFSFYRISFIKVLPCVTRSVGLTGFAIKRSHFESIVYHTRHLKELELGQCTLDSKEARFKHGEYKLARLNFSHTGNQRFSNWEKHKQKFTDIIKAISECSLRESIREICIRYCRIHQKEANEIAISHKLFGIMIIGVHSDDHGPYSFFVDDPSLTLEDMEGEDC